jgi:HAD superfamily hydrolase (TIGR01549 family)
MDKHGPTVLPRDGRAAVAGVLFDIDGTLTRTNDLIFATFNFIATKYCGRTYEPREIIALFGPPEEGALIPIVGEERLVEAMDDLCEFYSSHHHAMADLHAGMGDVLAFLKGMGIPLGVFTGKGRRTAMITLDALGIAGYFDLIVSGNDVVRHKPDPEGIRKFIGAFSLAPAEVLMVGDAMGDITASKGAGATSVAVLWDSYDRERVGGAGADFVFEEVSGFLSWLKKDVRYVPGGA